MAINYTKRGWTNNSPPAINAANLGAMDDALKLTADKVDTIAEGADVTATALASAIEGGTPTTTPDDTDKIPGVKSDHSRLYYTWANIKTALGSVFAPLTHASRHQHGGADEIATATPAANAIPKADSSGKLDSWISDASASTKGKVQLASTGVQDATKVPKATGAEIASLLDAGGYNLDGLDDGTTYKRVTAAQIAKLEGIEPLADVTDEANVTAIVNATAEVTSAPAHWWVLVGGALKRMTHAGWLTLVHAALPGAIEGGTATATPLDTDIVPGVKADHSRLYYTWADIKAAIVAAFPLASTTVAGKVTLATDGGVTAGTAVQASDTRIKNDMTIPVVTPTGFTWTAHPLVGKIWTDGKGNFRTNFDVAALKYVGAGVIRYVSPTGSDSADGLTAATPYASVTKALTVSNISEIRLLPGVYQSANVMGGGTALTKNISMVAWGGEVIFSTHTNATWALSSGQTYTYETALTSAPIAVLDTRAKNPLDDSVYSNLLLKTSIAEVEATAGTYYWASNVLYVHLSDGISPPTATTWALPSVGYNIYAAWSAATRTWYFEGITFYGGSYGGIGGGGRADHYIYAKNCKQYFSQRAGFRITGGNTIFQNCVSAWNPLDDGFSYHSNGADICYSVEIDCHGYKNGWATTGIANNNGSTTHDGNKIIRLRTIAHENRGPNIVDITTGTESWNLACVGFASASDSSNLGPVDFCFNAGNVKVWLDSCRGYSSAKTAIFGTTTDEVAAKVRNCNFEVAAEVGASSEKTTY